MIHAEVVARVSGTPDEVAQMLFDIERWPTLFPVTIRAVRVAERDGTRTVVEVEHRAGRVRNVLIAVSSREAVVEEWKPRYRARFRYRFDAEGHHTRLALTGEIWLERWATVLEPLLGRHVRRQMRKYVVEPIQRAVRYGRALPRGGQSATPSVAAGPSFV